MISNLSCKVIKFLKFLFFIFPIFFFLIISSDSFSKDWYRSYGDNESTRYSKLNQINLSNIKDLKKIWEFKFNISVNGRKVNQLTPIYIKNRIIITSLDGEIIGLNPSNGLKEWGVNLKQPRSRRGISSFDFNEVSYIVITTPDGLAIINGLNGTVSKKFGVNGYIKYPLPDMMSAVPPIINKSKVYIATKNKGIMAFNLFTGKLLWHRSLKSGNISPRIWSGFSFDVKTDSLFVVTSNPDDLIGTDRHFENDYSCSLLSINATDGTIKWSFQETKHDLWDFDLAGSPILTNVKINGENHRAVIALSKTGQIIYLKAKNGVPIFEDSIAKIKVPKSDLPDENNSETQIQILKPNRISNIQLDPLKDFRYGDKVSKDYLKMKTRWANYDHYSPPSLNYDAILLGLHGGANRSGGSLYKDKNRLIVSSNHEPWILRLFYKDTIFSAINKSILLFNSKFSQFFGYNSYKDSDYLRWENIKNSKIADDVYSYIPLIGINSNYSKNCSTCHGSAGQGFLQSESYGDKYYPPLSGISYTKKQSIMNTLKSLNSVHLNNEIKNLDEDKFNNIKSFMKRRDKILMNLGVLKVSGRWQVLHGKDGLPATKPPWGKITSIDLKTGGHDWTIPFGKMMNRNNEFFADGSINFGGLLSTRGELLFATGTNDKKHFAYNINNGDLVWSTKSKTSGSTSPMTYFHNKCQYILFVETGGSYVGFENISGGVSVFSLPECHPKK